MSLPSSIAELNENEFDLVDIDTLTNDGQYLTGMAVLVALDGSIEKVNFTHTRNAPQVKIYPDALTPASVVIWLERHGLADLTSDANEEMATHREWLNDKDTMGRLVGFVYGGRS